MTGEKTVRTGREQRTASQRRGSSKLTLSPCHLVKYTQRSARFRKLKSQESKVVRLGAGAEQVAGEAGDEVLQGEGAVALLAPMVDALRRRGMSEAMRIVEATAPREPAPVEPRELRRAHHARGRRPPGGRARLGP